MEKGETVSQAVERKRRQRLLPQRRAPRHVSGGPSNQGQASCAATAPPLARSDEFG